MNSPNPGAGKHCNGQFGHHRHINANTIALLNSLVFQHIGKLIYFKVKFFITQFPKMFLRVIGLPQYGGFMGMSGQMSIQTILGYIELSSFKPFNFRFGKVPFQQFIPLSFPCKGLSYRCPESLRVFNAMLILRLIFRKTGDKVHWINGV